MNELGSKERIRNIGEDERNGKDINRKIFKERRLKRIIWRLRIVIIVKEILVVDINSRRDRVFGEMKMKMEKRVNDRIIVDGMVERIEKLRIIERRIKSIIGKIWKVKERMLVKIEVGIRMKEIGIRRRRIGNKMELEGIEIMREKRRIGSDREEKIVDIRE